MRRIASTALLLASIAAPIGCGGTNGPAAPAASGGPVFGKGARDPGIGPWTASHILVGARNPRSPEVERSKPQALEAARAVMKRLEGGTKLEEIVAMYTDDKGSLGRRGEPDGQYTFGPGQMVPAFENAVRMTPIGKIYPDPVETEFGYHIIRRDK